MLFWFAKKVGEINFKKLMVLMQLAKDKGIEYKKQCSIAVQTGFMKIKKYFVVEQKPRSLKNFLLKTFKKQWNV